MIDAPTAGSPQTAPDLAAGQSNPATATANSAATKRASAPVLRAESITLGYDGRTIVESLDVELPPGKITVIVGANACGKSTLLRGLSRLLSPKEGAVTLDGKPISKIPAKQFARKVGLLPQTPIAPDGVSAADLVGRGRYPHQGFFQQTSTEDREIVADAMSVTKTIDFAERSVDELSGGQRQRVWIAMALAQQTDILLLDEPTTYLDVAHQVEVLDLITDLNRSRGTTIALVLHDINLASRYADHMIAMKSGAIVAQGAPSDVLTADCIKDVFGLTAEVLVDPVSGTPLIVPVGRHHAGGHQDAAPTAQPSPDQTAAASSSLSKASDVPWAMRRLSEDNDGALTHESTREHESFPATTAPQNAAHKEVPQ